MTERNYSPEQIAYLKARVAYEVAYKTNDITSDEWCDAHDAMREAEERLWAWVAETIGQKHGTEAKIQVEETMTRARRYPHYRQQVTDMAMKMDITL